MYKILGGDQQEYGPVTAEQVRAWASQRRVNAQTQVRADGETHWQPLGARPEFAGLFQAPPAFAPGAAAASGGDGGVNVLIPYKNPKALIAYYLAIFSLIPCLGLLLGIAAFILGLLGLKAAKAHPQA